MFPQTGQDGSELPEQLGRQHVEGSPSWEVVGRGQQLLAQVGQGSWGRLQQVQQAGGQVTLGKQAGGHVGFLQQVGDFTDLK